MWWGRCWRLRLRLPGAGAARARAGGERGSDLDPVALFRTRTGVRRRDEGCHSFQRDLDRAWRHGGEARQGRALHHGLPVGRGCHSGGDHRGGNARSGSARSSICRARRRGRANSAAASASASSWRIARRTLRHLGGDLRPHPQSGGGPARAASRASSVRRVSAPARRCPTRACTSFPRATRWWWNCRAAAAGDPAGAIPPAWPRTSAPDWSDAPARSRDHRSRWMRWRNRPASGPCRAAHDRPFVRAGACPGARARHSRGVAAAPGRDEGEADGLGFDVVAHGGSPRCRATSRCGAYGAATRKPTVRNVERGRYRVWSVHD